MPQLGPILKDESKLDFDYVGRNLSSSLSSLHFRNQILMLDNYFDKFQSMAERTWYGLHVNRPEYDKSDLDNLKSKSDKLINLFVRDGIFEAEVGWVGQGLQMWLQMIWFLAQCQNDDVIILDEPDVYLHPDMQRKLIRLVKNDFKQVILTTHSIEIISEVEPENILIIDKEKEKSQFAIKYSKVQKVLENMGSVHNISIAKLFSAKKFIVIEGDDLAILKRLYDKIFPNSIDPINSLPKMECGGWGGWQYAIGTYMGFNYPSEDNITVYCLLDSDYKTKEQIIDRKNEAMKKDIQLHIWEKKEVENYLLIPDLIKRFIEKRCTKNCKNLSAELIENKIEEICEKFKQEIEDNFSSEILKENKKLEAKTVNNLARKYVNEFWNNINNKCKIVPGKALISSLSQWSQSNYGVSFNPVQLSNETSLDEICDEIKEVLTKIENSEKFFEQQTN